MTVSVSSKSVTFTNGNPNDASEVNSEMTALFNNDATLAGAIDDVTDGTTPFTGQVTFNAGIKADTIAEKTAAAGVTADGVLLKDSQVSTNVINELTAASGVTIDSVLLKDGMVTVAGTAASNGQIGYASNALQAYINGSLKTLVTTNPGLVWLATKTASASASLDFQSYITSTYDEYQIHFFDIIPATDTADFHLLTSTNNGSSWDTGAGNYEWAFGNDNSGGTAGNAGSTADTKIKLKGSLGNNTGESASGWIKIYNPLGTSAYHHISWEIIGRDSAASFGRGSGGGSRIATADIDAIRLIMSTGNITSGHAHIYGVSKA